MALKDNYYTVPEAAKELNKTRQTIYRWIKDEIIKAETIGRETLIDKTEITRYKEDKFNSSIFQIFDIHVSKDNYQMIRDRFDYAKKDKIQKIGGEGELRYLITKQDGKREVVTIKEFSLSMNRKSAMLQGHVEPTNFERKEYKEEDATENEDSEKI